MPDSTREMTVAEVKAARKWYIRGAQDYGMRSEWPNMVQQAAREFPMPLIEKPREVMIGGMLVRVVDGRLQYHTPSAGWCQWLNAADPAALKDLLNNPTERVPADEDAP